MKINATLLEEEVTKVIQTYFVKAGFEEVEVTDNRDGTYSVSYEDYDFIQE